MSQQNINDDMKKKWMQNQIAQIKMVTTEIYKNKMDENILSDLIKILTEKNVLTSKDHAFINQNIKKLIAERDKEIQNVIAEFKRSMVAYEQQMAMNAMNQQAQQQQY